MAGRKKPEEEVRRGCPVWIITFSDVISLLVTFFVLILTFSTLEEQEFKRIAGSLQGAFGILGPDFMLNRTSFILKDISRADQLRVGGASSPFYRDLEKLERELEDLASTMRKGEELKMDRIDEGMRIRLEADRLFNPGSDTIRKGFMPVLEKLGSTLAYYPNRMVLEGHLDSAFNGSYSFPTPHELTGAMARSVAMVFTDKCGVLPKQIGIASYGACKPVANNSTAVGRALNRRVEIIVKDVQGGR